MPQLTPVPHGGALPDLGSTRINILTFATRAWQRVWPPTWRDLVRSAYRSGGATTGGRRRIARARMDYDFCPGTG